jgi:hypothetical protein
MKSDQRFTPKYWVFHNTKTDDVYLETASKSRSSCIDKAEQLHLEKLVDFLKNEESPYQVVLIEIRLFSDSEPYEDGILAVESKIYQP